MENSSSKKITKLEKQRYIDLWGASGKSKKSFSEEHGIKYYTFIDWTSPKRVGAKKIKPVIAEKGFIPLMVQQRGDAGVFAELHFSGGHRIVFHREIPASLFSLLLK